MPVRRARQRALISSVAAPCGDARADSVSVTADRRRDRWTPSAGTVLLLLAVVFLAGCHSTPSDQVVNRILAALAAAQALAPFREVAKREFRHFLRKRIRYLVGENSGWDAAPQYTSLTARIAAEMAALEAFLQIKIGPVGGRGPLGDEIDPHPFPHTDLRDVAKIHVDTEDLEVAAKAHEFSETRRKRVRAIVWRAAAIHSSLWQGSSSATTASLQTAALEELLDRRLRLVERMIHTDTTQGKAYWTIVSSTDWRDKLRTVLFEYPFIPEPDKPDGFTEAVVAAGETLATLHPQWYKRAPPRSEFRYRGSGRIPPPASAHWNLANYEWTMQPAGKTPAEIFDLLVPSVSPVPPKFENFWERNWLFCDHMAATLEVDALRFGLRRRTGSDTAFNSAATAGVTIHVPIPRAGNPDPTDLMAQGDDYFEGAALESVTDLQIGDLVIIWNNHFLRTVLATDFGLENSLISDIKGETAEEMHLVGHGVPDSKPRQFLVGHGMAETSYADFVGALVAPIGNLFKVWREFITDRINAADPAHDYLNTGAILTENIVSLQLVFWAPFEEQFEPKDAAQELQVPGAWWVRVPLERTRRGTGPPLTLDEALRLFPKSVAVDLPFHKKPKFLGNPGDAGYVAPAADYKESIYLPLSVPTRPGGGWDGYFKQVKADLDAGLFGPGLTKLADTVVDKDWAPGFHHGGPGTKIPVLRPKVRI